MLVLGFLLKEHAEIRREVRTDSRATLSEWRRRFLEDLAEARQLRFDDRFVAPVGRLLGVLLEAVVKPRRGPLFGWIDSADCD